MQTSPVEDKQLAQQARTNPEAFAELYRRHVRRVYSYQLAHTGNAKDAEDLTSQTFMAALEGLRSFRGEGSVAAWLMGIATRKKALFFRTNRRPMLSLDAAVQIPSPDPPTDEVALLRLQLQQISHALQHISPDRADVISLHFFGGLSHPEIGCVLGKTEAAVKMLLLRGLQDLRDRTSLALEAADGR